MAIAGSAINSAVAYLKADGTLHIGMYVMRNSDVVEQDMDRAIERIRAREPGGVVVWVHGFNVDTLRKAFASVSFE